MAEMLQKAGSLVKAANVVEKGSSSEAPSSVMVAVRCRPMNKRELDQKEAKIITMKEDGYAAIQPPEEGAAPREFSFDYTYDDDSIQQTVYDNLGAPLLNKAFEGWNGTIFAYGQTGAGKSFSMAGSPEHPGIIRKMNEEMFGRIADSNAANPELKFLVTCSYLEIYNEVLYDLLDPSGKSGTAKRKADSNIDIKEHPVLGVYVQGLQEIAVDSHAKIQALMDQGQEMRAVASTNMNATSSRSHSIFIIKMTQKIVIAGQQKDTRATINLVDLAGSERVSKTGATGDKLKEGANINKSLSALGNVINALAEQSKKSKKVFIPYRNSKLTRVLQESLGGNSVTVMLAAISPAAYNYEETLNTLQYADRAKAIQLKARKNETMTEVGKLKAEIEELKAALAAQAAGGGGGGGGPGGGVSPEMQAQMQAQIDDYNLMMKQSFEEKERMAQARTPAQFCCAILLRNCAAQFSDGASTTSAGDGDAAPGDAPKGRGRARRAPRQTGGREAAAARDAARRLRPRAAREHQEPRPRAVRARRVHRRRRRAGGRPPRVGGGDARARVVHPGAAGRARQGGRAVPKGRREAAGPRGHES